MQAHKAKMKRKTEERARRYDHHLYGVRRPLITANLSRNHPDAGKSIHGITLASARDLAQELGVGDDD